MGAETCRNFKGRTPVTIEEPDDSLRRRFPQAGGGLALPIAFTPRMIGDALTASSFAEQFTKVNGVRLRYLVGGKGGPVALLHGYTQTSHMWHPHMEPSSRRHTVIGHWLMEEAPDTVIQAIIDFIN